jgi:hypothetical protein
MKRLTAVFLIAGSLVLSATAMAADIRVQVYDRVANAPLANAAVCVGTAANIDQFGASMTDAQGSTVFSGVPRAAIVVTVSSGGYKSEQETIVNSTSNRTLVMSLSTGGGGTPCPLVASDNRVYEGGMVVSRFSLANGKADTTDRTVTLNNTVKGAVTQYRASEQADFSGAEWQDYSTAPSFTLSTGPGKKLVYFQARRHANVNGAVIETLSPVVRDSITLN